MIAAFVCVSRPDTLAAALIERASAVVMPGPSPLGWHATHAYLTVVSDGCAWRLDAEIRGSQWTPYHRGGPEPRFAWRIEDGLAVVRKARALGRVPYDPLEIAASALRVAGVSAPGGDGIRGAMVCTQLTAHLLGWSLPDLFPERITRACEARAGFGITRARLDEVCDD